MKLCIIYICNYKFTIYINLQANNEALAELFAVNAGERSSEEFTI